MNKDRTWLVIEEHPCFPRTAVRFGLTELGARRVAAKLTRNYAGVGYRYHAEDRSEYYRGSPITKENTQ